MLRKILLIIDSIFLVIAVAVGIDYTYYIANIKYVNHNETVILSDIINLNIEDKNIVYEVTKDSEYKFNVENLSDKETSYNLLFSNIENEFDSNLIYELYEDDKLSVSKTVAPKSGGNSYIKLNITIKPAEKKYYTLKFNTLNTEEVDNKKFQATLNIDSLKINDSIKTASNYLLAFNQIGIEEDNGLFESKDTNTGSSYYFKGNVINNYVSINNELYRILRINENGNIRIIKDTNLSINTQFNTESKLENSYDYKNSNVANYLNSYYESNLKNIDNLIAEDDYCNEVHAVKSDNYKVSDTNINYNEYTPSLKCSNPLKLKIGLISYDETVLAGVTYNSSYGSNNYLLNGLNKNTWTISPAGSYSYTNDRYVWKITDNKSITETLVTNSITSIRPVINLKATLNITGNGTIDDPYIFSE